MPTVSPHPLFQKDFGLGIFEAFRGGGRRGAPVGAGGRVAEEAAGQEEAAVRPQPPLHRGLAEELGVLPEQRGPGGLAGGEARVARPALARHHRLVCETGPGNLEKDMERRFSYALSREDIENAVLGGP
ncbi:hypothetical protein C1H46_019885 [Malus baccata]|uniref:Uncharacterized protein n=1 Tax=Malus baccata TaxID=106549 RepID=A0A540M7B3_MALBA|nr:hypothetical protein C1H46_019885 [Malus baccata]